MISLTELLSYLGRKMMLKIHARQQCWGSLSSPGCSAHNARMSLHTTSQTLISPDTEPAPAGTTLPSFVYVLYAPPPPSPLPLLPPPSPLHTCTILPTPPPPHLHHPPHDEPGVARDHHHLPLHDHAQCC